MNRYPLAAALTLSATVCLAQGVEAPLPEAADSQLGYRSVSEALAALKAKPGVNVRVTKPDGWIIVTESTPDMPIWSFTPEGHYAHPAVVRRALKRDPNGVVQIEMNALCQAEKAPCDRLIREFLQLNERLVEQVRSRTPQGNAQQ